jgi:adenylate cyclase
MNSNGPEINSLGEEPLKDLLLQRKRVVIMVIDMVESVRLIAQNESSVVARWMDFTKTVRTETIPKFQGNLVKSLGDGLMLTFKDPSQALMAGEEMHQILDQLHSKSIIQNASNERMAIRIGIHSGEVITDDIDIFGHSANVAARITSMGGPGEIIITGYLRDEISDGLDAEVEDLGPHFFKNLNESIGVYRVIRQQAPNISIPRKDYETPLYPTLAVIPFESVSMENEHLSIGDLLADGVIGHLGQTKSLKVISRLSTRAFRNRNSSLTEIASKLGANFVLSGSYIVSEPGKTGRLALNVELASVTSDQIIWSDRMVGTISDLIAFESELCRTIAHSCCRAILESELSKVWCQPFDTLSAYSLNLSGVKLMHASAPREFNRSLEVFQALSERHSRFSEPYAWRAKWHVLRVIRGLSSDPRADAQNALEACDRALNLNPMHSTAHALKGYTLCQVFADREGSKVALDNAVEIMPSEIHAWLGKSVWEQHWGDVAQAVVHAKKAQSISPLDPYGSFQESILAAAYTLNNEHELGISTAQNCLRLDRNHTPAIRTMLLSQVELGRMDDAKITAENLLRITPNFTLRSYQSMGNMDSNSRKRVYAAMSAVGIR